MNKFTYYVLDRVAQKYLWILQDRLQVYPNGGEFFVYILLIHITKHHVIIAV